MQWRTYRRGSLIQQLACGDICDTPTQCAIIDALPPALGMVYSDPPWNPGNAQWWRRHASVDLTPSFAALVAGWHAIVAACCVRGASHVCCEQSMQQRHQAVFHAARHGWDLPCYEEYQVFYGSPGSASLRRPNRLLHFGTHPLLTDPTDMVGEAMTIRVCAGVALPCEAWIIDPCMGKGMTSRMAHYFGWNCLGIELNAHRLACASAWLERQGYVCT